MALETFRQKWLLIGLSTIAAFGGLLFGYDTGVISGAILFIKEEFHLSTIQEERIISIVAIGAIVGALVGGPLSDFLGRKRLVLFSSLVFLLSAILLALANHITTLVIGRLIVGFAIGITSATAPLYIAEIAPLSMRGALVTLNQLTITIGILLAYITDYSLARIHGWRIMFLLAAIPSSIQFIVMLFFPESPRWLTLNHKEGRALKILQKYRGSSEDAKLEIAHIKQILSEKKESWLSLFTPTVRPALIAGIARKYVPETRFKSLEEIEEQWLKR